MRGTFGMTVRLNLLQTLQRKGDPSVTGVAAAVAILAMPALAPATCRAELPKPSPSEIVPTANDPLHHVIYEDADLRLYRVLIRPGQSTKWHEQHLDYVNTAIQGTPIHKESLDESPKDAVMSPDAVRFLPYRAKADVDIVRNTGDRVNHQVTFEIKRATSKTPGSPVRPDGGTFRLVLDKPSVRGWRVHLEPGESTGRYRMGAPVVRIVLGTGRLLVRDGDSTVWRQQRVDLADAFVLPAGMTEVVNGSDSAIDYNEFELK